MGYASFRFYRIADGKVVETWAMQDRLGLLQQLGAIPGPETDVEWADQTEELCSRPSTDATNAPLALFDL